MTLLLSEDDVRVLLDMPTAIEAVEQSFRRQAAGDAWLHPRRRFELPDRVFLNYMAAADRADGWMGLKVYTVARGAARFVVLLYRATTGELAAIIEADFLGQMRTGAATENRPIYRRTIERKARIHRIAGPSPLDRCIRPTHMPVARK